MNHVRMAVAAVQHGPHPPRRPMKPSPREVGFNQAGLCELTGQDWLLAAACGIDETLATTAISL